MHRSVIAVALGTLLSAAPLAAQGSSQTSGDRAEVLTVTERMVEAMRVRDTAALKRLFLPGARLVGMRTRRGAEAAHVQALTPEQFADFVARDTTRGTWIERLWSPRVEVDGTLATVWAEYDFHFDQRFSHCGVDAFQLLKTAEGWRIASLADTYRTEGCVERPAPEGVRAQRAPTPGGP